MSRKLAALHADIEINGLTLRALDWDEQRDDLRHLHVAIGAVSLVEARIVPRVVAGGGSWHLAVFAPGRRLPAAFTPGDAAATAGGFSNVRVWQRVSAVTAAWSLVTAGDLSAVLTLLVATARHVAKDQVRKVEGHAMWPLDWHGACHAVGVSPSFEVIE